MMDDEKRMENLKDQKVKIEWAGLEYNPMLPHEIKKFVEDRKRNRLPSAALADAIRGIQPGSGLRFGPIKSDEIERAAKTAQNVVAKMKWPEGYNLGRVIDKDGNIWLAIVRGAKAKLPHSYAIILDDLP